MLGGGEIASAAINLLIAVYLIVFYPRVVRRHFRDKPMLPLFGKLMKIAPVAGYLLAAGTLIYLALRLAGISG